MYMPIKFDIQELLIKRDPSVHLIAIIAFDNLAYGPGCGGTRFLHYDTLEDAMKDVIQLAKTMSCKFFIYQLPYSGSKAVLLKPEVPINREKYFRSYGKIINELNGQFITGCDVGVSIHDMLTTAKQTKYITGLSSDSNMVYLSYFTAFSLFRACEAAVKFKLGKDNMQGIHINIQGVGKIGYTFAQMVQAQGAKLTICDLNPRIANECAKKLGAAVVDPMAIYSKPCDIFSPCSLGWIINEETIDKLDAAIICGGANNQLKKEILDQLLYKKNMLYVPDFVANGGGATYAVGSYEHVSNDRIFQFLTQKTYELCMAIFTRSLKSHIGTNQAANEIIKECKLTREQDLLNSPLFQSKTKHHT